MPWLRKQFLLQTVSLTQTQLEQVALDGALEKAFGHGDHYPVEPGAGSLKAAATEMGRIVPPSLARQRGYGRLSGQSFFLGKSCLQFIWSLKKRQSL